MTTNHAKTAKGTRTRDRMLDSAVVLIPRLGWSAVTARALAGHAGVRPGIIHYHFASLEALLAEAAVGAVREALEYPSRQLESGTVLTKDCTCSSPHWTSSRRTNRSICCSSKHSWRQRVAGC